MHYLAFDNERPVAAAALFVRTGFQPWEMGTALFVDGVAPPDEHLTIALAFIIADS